MILWIFILRIYFLSLDIVNFKVYYIDVHIKKNYMEVSSMSLLVAIDNGNSNVGVNFGGLDNYFTFPNVLVREGEKRDSAKKEKTLLESMHFCVESSLLYEYNRKIFVAGKLATKYDKDRHIQVQPNTKKTENEQSYISLFLSSAVAAVKSGQFNEYRDAAGRRCISAVITLGVGIPMEEFMEGLGDDFAENLKNRNHVITFLQATGAEGLRVNLQFDHVRPMGEGLPAIYALGASRRDSEAPLIPELFNYETIALGDLGGGSSEVIVIEEDGTPNNGLTRGINSLGVNKYLDNIGEEARKKGVTGLSRTAVTDSIKRRDYVFRTLVQAMGRKKNNSNISIEDIVNYEIDVLSDQVYNQMFDPIYQAVPRLGIYVMIGGGSLVIQSHFYQKFGNIVKFVGKTEPIEGDIKYPVVLRLNADGILLLLEQEIGELV